MKTPSGPMPTTPVRLYFDFVDPLSYVASRALGGVGEMAEWVGFELLPAPAPLTAGNDPFWVARRRAAGQAAERLGLELAPPALVPWSRKAHELHLYATEHGRGAEIRAAVFDAFFREGRDIGRVDVLVELAGAVGLDRTETKAVLDVDRHEADVTAARAEAQKAGVTDVPSHVVSGRVVEGFPDPTDLGTLLPDDQRS